MIEEVDRRVAGVPGRRAAGRAGLACRDLDGVVGFQSGHEAPAAAVAWLLVEALAAGGLPAAGPA